MVDGQFLLPNGKGDTKPVSHTSNPAPHPSRSTPAGWAVTENDDRARATRDVDRTADPQSARQVAHIARNEALLTPPITDILGGLLRSFSPPICAGGLGCVGNAGIEYGE